MIIVMQYLTMQVCSIFHPHPHPPTNPLTHDPLGHPITRYPSPIMDITVAVTPHTLISLENMQSCWQGISHNHGHSTFIVQWRV